MLTALRPDGLGIGINCVDFTLFRFSFVVLRGGVPSARHQIKCGEGGRRAHRGEHGLGNLGAGITARNVAPGDVHGLHYSG